jgi:MFS family permease
MRLWPQGGLWRHRDFLKLWSAETISQFGTAITGLALPLVAIIVLHATAFEVAALATIEFAPFILFSLPAGVWVDRLRRRPILIVGDLGRALLLASIPIVHFAGGLTIWQLYAVGFLVGTLTVFFDVAYQSYLPSLVERRDLVEGNSKLEVSRSGAQIAGPGFAGGIISVLTAPYAIVLDAVSFFGSALLVFGIGKQEFNPSGGEKVQRRSMASELGEGLRFVLGHRYLRNIAASTATFNFFFNSFGAILLVYLVRRLHWSPGLIGLTGSLASTGALLGALTANKVAGRIGVGRAIVWAQVATVFGLLIPLAPQDKYRSIPFFVVAEFVIGAAVVIYNVNQLSLRQGCGRRSGSASSAPCSPPSRSACPRCGPSNESRSRSKRPTSSTLSSPTPPPSRSSPQGSECVSCCVTGTLASSSPAGPFRPSATRRCSWSSGSGPRISPARAPRPGSYSSSWSCRRSCRPSRASSSTACRAGRC